MDQTRPNHSMKPTAPLRCNISVLVTTPRISSRCPATLVRLKLVRCPHLLAPTLVILPSMSHRFPQAPFSVPLDGFEPPIMRDAFHPKSLLGLLTEVVLIGVSVFLAL